MSIANFVPEIWSTLLLRYLDASLVFAQPNVVNRSYEGEISQAGDTVRIQKIGSVTVKEYDKDEGIEGPEQATSTTLSLIIDELYYWNIGVKSVDAVQANINLLEPRLQRAAYEMAVKIDESVASAIVAGAGLTDDLGEAGSPLSIGNSDEDDSSMFDLAVEFRRQLDNQNAPTEGRWIAIHPDLEATVLTDTRFVNTASEIGSGVVRTGAIGQIAGFDLLKTTAIPEDDGEYAICFGAGNYGLAHANQLTDLRAFEPENDFQDAVKALQVWGNKVVEPETLGVAIVANPNPAPSPDPDPDPDPEPEPDPDPDPEPDND